MDTGPSGVVTDATGSYPLYPLLLEHWVLVASAGLVFYDYLLTLSLEVRLLRRRRKLTAPTVIFLLNRYIALARYAVDVWTQILPSTAVSCPRLVMTTNVLVVTMYVIWAVFATIRTYPFATTRWLPAIVFTMYLCPVAAQTFLFVKGAPPLFLSPALCLQVDRLPWYFNTAFALIARLAMIVADVLVVVSVGKYTRATREAAKQAEFKCSLGRILLRNGVLYFLILSLLNLVHLACWLTGFFSSFMGTLGEALTSIVITRFVLNLWDCDRSGVTTDTTARSQLSVSLHFATSPSSCDAGAELNSSSCHGNADVPSPTHVQAETSSFRRRLVEFMEPLGAPVGGFLGEGLAEEDRNDSEPDVAYVFDVEEAWRDALNKSGCGDCEV